MAKWQLQEAKARFSELIDDTLEKGPQVITRRGVDTAVIVSVEQWRRAQPSERRTLKDVLLGPGPRFDMAIPKRGRGRWRKPLVLD